jgi:hypothetical protein
MDCHEVEGAKMTPWSSVYLMYVRQLLSALQNIFDSVLRDRPH